MAWLTDWNYRKAITISNTGSALTDYQVLVILDTLALAGKIQSDCSDMRFTSSDDSTLLNYWIESGCNTSSTKIWIKIPSISASPSTTTIYLYYGKSGTSAVSNGTSTFIAFNDFNADYGYTIIDTGVTESFGNATGEIRTNNGRLDYVAFSYAKNSYMYKDYGAGYFAGDLILEFDEEVTGAGVSSAISVGFTDDLAGTAANNNADIVYITPGSLTIANANAAWHSQGNADTNSAYINISSGPAYYRLIRSGATLTLRMYSDSARTVEIAGSPSSISTNSQALRYLMAIDRLTLVPNGRSMTGWVDNIRVRKYAATEPTTCIGEEQVPTVSWLSGWNRRKLVTITGSTVGAQTDYQMKLIVHKATGTDTSTDIYLGTNVNNDFSDLRFTSSDGSTLLSYWIESYTSGSVATVWIKIPSVPTGPCTTTVYLYYGNSGASAASNGTNTFIIFNAGDTLTGTTAVTIAGGGYQAPVWSIVNNKIRGSPGSLNSTGILYFNTTTGTSSYIIEADIQASAAGGSLNNQFGLRFHTSQSPAISRLQAYWVEVSKRYYIDDSTGTEVGSSITTLSATLHKWKLVNNGSVKTLYIDGTQVVTQTETIDAENIGLYYYNASGEYVTEDYSNIRVRKYTATEPTFSASGAEQTSPNITATAMSITPSENPCRTGICTVTIVVTWSNSGGTDGTVIPNIKIDTISQIAHAPRIVIAGSYIDETFIVSGLSVGTHAICPDPN